MPDLLARDFESVYDRTKSLWKDLRGGRIFLTGGTGFTGCWLLESFARANDQLDLNARAVVLTRDPRAFQHKAPHLARHPAIELHAGDVRNFSFPAGRFTHIIHAAAERNPRLYAEHPMRMLDIMLSGTRRVLDLALQCGTPKFLLVSSGAVYGCQPPNLVHIPEDYSGQPDVRDPWSGYAEGKRLSETLCLTYGKTYGLQVKIGRCFPFLGPYLSPNPASTAGRFILEGLHGGPIRVNGGRDSRCSYLYATDLAVWLWTILVRGECGRAYNVGSEQATTIAELARQIGQAFEPPVEVRQTPTADSASGAGPALAGGEAAGENEPGLAECGVPSTQAAQTQLQLTQEISLEEAIHRTILWARSLSQAQASPGLAGPGSA